MDHFTLLLIALLKFSSYQFASRGRLELPLVNNAQGYLIPSIYKQATKKTFHLYKGLFDTQVTTIDF